jgi:hypothetical protein
MRVLAFAAFALLAACSTDSPYREKSPLFTSGVSAEPLKDGQFGISSTGAGQDRPQIIALHAMRKSAETTLAQGKTHFEVTLVSMGLLTKEISMIILPVNAAAAAPGVYDAAAVKREAEAFKGTAEEVPESLLPVAKPPA